MTNTQENELSMNKVLLNLFAENGTIIDSYTKLKPLCTLFGENVGKIDVLGEQQGVDKKSTTDSKDMTRVALIEETVKVGDRLTAFATFENKPELLSEVKVVKSALERYADTKLKNTASAILKSGRTYATEAVDYKLTDKLLDSLEGLITGYDTEIPQPTLSVKEKARITAELKKTFAEQKITLKQIRVFMKVVKEEQPEFVASFENMSKVVSYGTGSLAVKCQVNDAATGLGIANVDVEFNQTDGELTKTVKRSSAKGGINIDTMPEGAYIVTASKLGYADNVKHVNVISGELCNIVIVMVKS